MTPLPITSNVFRHVTQFEHCSQSTGYVHLEPWPLVVNLSRSKYGRDVNQNTLHCRNVRTNNPTTTIPGLGWNQWHIHAGVLVVRRGLFDMPVWHTTTIPGTHPHVCPLQPDALVLSTLLFPSYCTAQPHTICCPVTHNIWILFFLVLSFRACW
jgi:hypothetical protein